VVLAPPAHAVSHNAIRKAALPWRALPLRVLPSDSCRPGTAPPRRPEMARRRVSVPAHPGLGDDHLGASPAGTGMVVSRRSWSHKGAITLSPSASSTAIWGFEVVDGRQMSFQHDRVVGAEAADQRQAQVGDPGSHPGESHIREDPLHPPGLLVPVLDQLLPISGQARSSAITGGVTKLTRRRPHSANCASHAAVNRSVLRPGRFLTWRPLTERVASAILRPRHQV